MWIKLYAIGTRLDGPDLTQTWTHYEDVNTSFTDQFGSDPGDHVIFRVDARVDLFNMEVVE